MSDPSIKTNEDNMTDKKFAELQIEEIDGKKVFVATDETVDREGEVLAIDGWQLENFKRNPILLWSHNPFEPLIGLAENIRFRTLGGKKKMTFEPVFHRMNEMSRLVADLVDKGWMKTVSVGFRPYEKQGNKFTKQELLEISFVNIPANPEATHLAFSKGYGKETVKSIFGDDVKEEEVESKTVIPFADTVKSEKDADWQGQDEVASAEISDLKAMCAWYDSEKPDTKASYKLPHHKSDADHTVVWRGVIAAMANLLGARGGVDIPETDRKAVYDHLAKHYEQFGETPPEFRAYTVSELKQVFPNQVIDYEGEIKSLNEEINQLEKSRIEAHPSVEQGPVPVKGRQQASKDNRFAVKRYLQIASKATSRALELSKK